VDATTMPHQRHANKGSHVGIFFIQPVYDVAFDVVVEKVTWQPKKMTWHA